MELKQHKDHHIFTPTRLNDSRLKVLYAGESIVCLSIAVWLGSMLAGVTLSMIENMSLGITVIALVVFAATLFFLLVSLRFLAKIYDKEQIIITEDVLILTGKKWFKETAKRYFLSEIESMTYQGYGQKTSNPMMGSGHDYLGLETREREVAKINDEGNLSFPFQYRIVHFGKDISTWDAQKISDILYKTTGGRLFIQGLPEEMSEDIYMHGQR